MTHDHETVLRDTRPPDGVDEPRAGVTCGRPGCPRIVLTASSRMALQLAIDAWRCPRCERGCV